MASTLSTRAVPAAAADSWVLWHVTQERVSPYDTFPTKAVCQAKGWAVMADVARDSRNRRATGDTVELVDSGLTVIARSDGQLMTLNTMRCWPVGVTPGPLGR